MSDFGFPVDEPAPTTFKSIGLRALERVDSWCERIGDSVNPIMVKEARQALKSRQFIFTFSALLLAALAWTIVGSLSIMPQIYTSPSAPRLLIGYYFLLAVPMLLVVPMAAYRSLEGEIDDGTLELLSISALGPWQIVLGKLASAILQMGLYFVALFPCMAYAYNLRGVDLPTMLILLGILLTAAVMLTIAALFMAAISSSRTGRIASLFVIVAALLVVQWFLGAAVVDLIIHGNPLEGGQLVFAITATIAASLSIGNLLLTSTAVQLTPESENRSTKIRIAMLLIGAVQIGLAVLAVLSLAQDAEEWIISTSMATALLWTVVGSMMAAESPIQTPRIRRELPQSFLARCMLTWLTPGPATGLVFAIVNIVTLTAITCVGIQFASTRLAWASRNLGDAAWMLAGGTAYLVGFLVLVRVIVAIIRTKSHPRAEIGLVVLIIVGILFALTPYSIQLHLNDYRDYNYSHLQITNWAWTIREIERNTAVRPVVFIVAASSCIAFIISLASSSHLVLPRRTATPERVLQASKR